MFDLVGRPMVQAVLAGFNSTIFAYGQTGSGKTYTMFGPEKRKNELDLGLVQRCCTYLFDKLKKSSAEVVEWQVSASFIQIYKEHLSDLLEPSMRNLQIRTNFQTDAPYVENLKTVAVNNIEDVLINLGIAFSNRIVASHKLNSESSRSHMLLMMDIEQKTRDGAVKKSKLNFGDLAGSEDIRKALGANPDPERMKEAIGINASLTALTTAINNLSKGQRPSYRSSSLTHLLQDSLGGNSKTTMLVAASPHIMNRAETIRTLRFAMTAKTVKNKAKINKQLTRGQLTRRIEELEALNAKLKNRVMELETEMQAAGLEVELTEELYNDDAADGNDWSSADDDDEDAPSKGKKKKKKKLKKAKNGGAKMTNSKSQPTPSAKMESEKGLILARRGSTAPEKAQLEHLKKEVDAANERAKAAQQRNASLEKRTMDLTAEIDGMAQTLQEKRESMEKMTSQASAQAKERVLLETRNSELQKEVDTMQASLTKQTVEIDRQMQRQRNNVNMKTQENKELQKQIKERELENEALATQNDLFQKQMRALRARVTALEKSGGKKLNASDMAAMPMDADTAKLVEELDAVQLDTEERKMAPADLLMHRFAAMEANDWRLTGEQRMKKTAKMMTDISDDIGTLMGEWLPKKHKSAQIGSEKGGTPLVFQVRQLIGHFNVLVKQMRTTEQSFQNDLKLDIKRRDQEIKRLKVEAQKTHQLQDDLQEKDDVIVQLRRHRDDLRVERDHLKAQTVEQQDMIFDVQNQVRYLNTELERNRSTIVELKAAKSKGKHSVAASQTLNIASILDGEEPPSSSEDSDGDNGDVLSPSSMRSPMNNAQSKRKSGSAMSTNKRRGHQPMESEEIMYMTDEDEESTPSTTRTPGPKTRPEMSNENTTVIHEEVDDEDASDDDDRKDGGYEKLKAAPNSKKAKDKKRRRRKSTMSIWRESLKPSDQLDCKDESGLWWTARVVGYKGSSDKLQIRYDGWGENYDEVIDRGSDRLAVYRSMFHSRDQGGKKLIREGYMSKEGKMFKTWRKRYFTLDDTGKLAYYHDKGNENAIGSVDICKMQKTERQSFGRNKPYGMQIHTDVRVWKFLCQTEKDLAEWIHAFNFVKEGKFTEDD